MLSAMTSATSRVPVVYVPHGGGPWPFVKIGIGDQAEQLFAQPA